MDAIMQSLRGLTLGNELDQNNLNLRADITKLRNICEMVVDSMNGFIIEIYVSPVNMIQREFKDLKRLKFSIVYNGSVESSLLSDKKEECSSLLETFICDEFENVDKLEKVHYSTQVNWDYPSLLLYTVFPKPSISNLTEKTLELLKTLLDDSKFRISIPYSFCFMKTKTFFIHLESISDAANAESDMNKSKELYGIKIDVYKDDKTKYNSYVYIPFIGFTELPYEIPYMYITLNEVDAFLENNSECIKTK